MARIDVAPGRRFRCLLNFTPPAWSIVIAALKKVYSLTLHHVDEPVLLRNAPRPDAFSEVPEGLRPTDSSKRLTQDSVYKVRNA